MLLSLENMDSYMTLFGMNDRHMAVLEQELNVSITLRGQELKIDGAAEDVALAEQVIGKMIDMLRHGEIIDASRIRSAATGTDRDASKSAASNRVAVCIVK